ncbi:MAG TPA: hypothetical protein VJV03_16655 [Pyrinomonadaceae bacterium]|nr:hypothetical protein [Pyrinomonadaceae bacterium]
MNFSFARRVRYSLLGLLLLTVQIGCQGPPGPQGPAGPAGPGGGPPYVWTCTPAMYPMSGSNTRADLYIFNGSATTANIAVHILDKNGNNLAGVNIPGTNPAAPYPGQTGSATEALPASNTRIVTWQTPVDSPPGGPNVSATVRVVSDQPITVGSDFQWSGFKPLPCTFLPK